MHHPVAVLASDGPASSAPPGGDELMGKRVEGVVDGAFDVGYFLTVRVNGCLLRGIIWQEDTCMRAVGQHAAQQQKQKRTKGVGKKSRGGGGSGRGGGGGAGVGVGVGGGGVGMGGLDASGVAMNGVGGMGGMQAPPPLMPMGV